MIHHYTQKGFTLEYLLNLDPFEKDLYKTSMDLHFEEEAAKWSST